MMNLLPHNDLRESERVGQQWRGNSLEDDEPDQALMILDKGTGSVEDREGYGLRVKSPLRCNDLGGRWS